LDASRDRLLVDFASDEEKYTKISFAGASIPILRFMAIYLGGERDLERLRKNPQNAASPTKNCELKCWKKRRLVMAFRVDGSQTSLLAYHRL
jgi:hypothetical protein